MQHDIIQAIRTLREDMRQRLMQAPEYRALEALDRSIEEIDAIMREPPAPVMAEQPTAPASHGAPAMVESIAPVPAPSRQSAIASAFAETLAAKMDQRAGARPGPYPLAARAMGG